MLNVLRIYGMNVCTSWLLSVCNLSTFHLWCMCPACGLLYTYIMGATFLLNVYCVLHISWALCECCVHWMLFHSFHIVCCLQTQSIFHVLHVRAMCYMWHPCPCTMHGVNCVVCAYMGCMCSCSGFRQLCTSLPCASDHPDLG